MCICICAIVREKTRFLLSPIPRGQGGLMDPVIFEPARGHTLLEVVIADPTRVDLVARAIVVCTMRCCAKRMNSCASALGEHFPRMADHLPLQASSSLGFGTVSRSHFRMRKLERFMRARLVLRPLHLRYLHFPLTRLSQLGITKFS